MKGLLKGLEDWLLVCLLKRVGKEMSYKVFCAVAGKFVIATALLVILRKRGNATQVLLTQRDPGNDPYWAGLWEIPGTAIRKSDDFGNPIGSADPIRRLERLEIKTKVMDTRLILITPLEAERGKEISFIYVGRISEEVPPCGKFFDVDDLPPMVSSNASLLKEVLQLI